MKQRVLRWVVLKEEDERKSEALVGLKEEGEEPGGAKQESKKSKFGGPNAVINLSKIHCPMSTFTTEGHIYYRE